MARRVDPLYSASVPQITLFTGENAFTLREEKLRWTRGFTEKYGPENLVQLDGATLTSRQLLDEISVMPFLAAKRLVVVDGLPKVDKEEAESIPRNIHPEVVLVFLQRPGSGVRKNAAGTKELLKIMDDTKEFAAVKGPKLLSWLQARLSAHHVRMSADAMQKLLELLGDDQEMLSQEVAKLALSAADRKSVV